MMTQVGGALVDSVVVFMGIGYRWSTGLPERKP